MILHKEFIARVVAPVQRLEKAWWFAFQEDKLLIQQGLPVTIPCLVDFAELELPVLREHYLGSLDGRDCYTVEVPKDIAPPHGMSFEGLRQVYGQMDEALYAVAGRAEEIIEWDRTNQFCGRCGVRTRTHSTERAKECPRCGFLHFPRLAPAVIVLVERGDEMLLARGRRFTTDMYSTIAGFVEPGETLEEAVVREVWEESGITVNNVRYFGSQPWPFPNSLMVGFTATYASGEIKSDNEENLDVAWFTISRLPAKLPGKISIARRLIDSFIERQTRRQKAGA
jgi:NAD+ diphosphatase